MNDYIFPHKKLILLAVLLCIGVFLNAQTSENNDDADEKINSDTPIQSDWSAERYSMYSTGDKVFCMSAGLLFPMFMTGASYNKIPNKINLGGTGSLAYNYFLNTNVFIGGELQGAFASTIGEHTVFLVPFGFRAGYQFIVNRFEIPVSAMLGGAAQIYNGHDLFGMFLKLQASGFYRFNPDWSFGLNAAFWWVPEWTSEPQDNAYGHFFELTLSARYHF